MPEWSSNARLVASCQWALTSASPPIAFVVPGVVTRVGPLRSLFSLLLALGLVLFGPTGTVLAVSIADLPQKLPTAHVVDSASVLSRAGTAEIEKQLASFGGERVDARLITVSRLDYGLDLQSLGEQVLSRWSSNAPAGNGADPLLLLLIDSQTRATAIVAQAPLERQLPPELLTSTASTTMAQPLREGDRFRQASIDALLRLDTVLQGGEDPGEPVVIEAATVVSNIPTREETSSSRAFTWVIVLLVVGSVVPMLTWWVFSR
jgi:uncharacterized protein